MRMNEWSTYLSNFHTHYTFSFSASLHPLHPEFVRGIADEESNLHDPAMCATSMSLLTRHWRTILFEVYEVTTRQRARIETSGLESQMAPLV